MFLFPRNFCMCKAIVMSVQSRGKLKFSCVFRNFFGTTQWHLWSLKINVSTFVFIYFYLFFITTGGSLESDDEFELVGTLLGLAIYNGVILNVHFPMAIYKKLHGEPLDMVDLIDVMPSVGKGLQDMLDYEGDVEDTFCQTFQVRNRNYQTIIKISDKKKIKFPVKVTARRSLCLQLEVPISFSVAIEPDHYFELPLMVLTHNIKRCYFNSYLVYHNSLVKRVDSSFEKKCLYSITVDLWTLS